MLGAHGRLTHPAAQRLAYLLMVMLVVFPKGGLRLAGLPITWGYLLLFFATVLLLPYRLLIVRATYYRRQAVALLMQVPFATLFFYTAAVNGIAGPDARGGFISTGTSLLFFPLLFLAFFPPMLHLLDGNGLAKCFRWSVLAAALFGLFQFVWRPLTGAFLELPYLTMNGDDLGDLAATKNIARGFLFKLISTYNNGNIYGAATLILLRLFDHFSTAAWQRWALRVALFLTLSRTIWAGLVFDQLLTLAGVLIAQRHRFPRVQLGRVTTIFFTLGMLAPAIVIILRIAGRTNAGAFVFDPNLGGRTGGLYVAAARPLLPMFPTTFGFTEIVYASAALSYGLLGVPAICFVLLSPLVVVLLDRRAVQDPVRRAAFEGLLLYAFICLSDGALNLIPIMAFYWFTYMIFLFGWPQRSAVRASVPVSPVLLPELSTPLLHPTL